MTTSRFMLPIALFGVLAAGCSDPVPPPSQGGVRINYRPSTIAQSGACSIGAHTVGVAQGGAYPQHTTGNPGKRVVDGQDGAEVRCRVTGANSFVFSGSLSKDAVSFSVAGRVEKGGEGTGTVAASDSQTAQHVFSPVQSQQDPDCTFKVNENKLEVAPGRIWAVYDCPATRDTVNFDIVCGLGGEFVLENCDQ